MECGVVSKFSPVKLAMNRNIQFEIPYSFVPETRDEIPIAYGTRHGSEETLGKKHDGQSNSHLRFTLVSPY